MAKQDQAQTDLEKRVAKLGVGATNLNVSRDVQLAVAQRLLAEVEVGIHELRSRIRLKMLIGGAEREVLALCDSVEKTLVARDALAAEIASLSK
jgi:hypothetical protein